MAWYGHRRSGLMRSGAPAVVAGLGIAMLGVLAVQTSSVVRSGIDSSRASMDGATANMASFATATTSMSLGFGRDKAAEEEIARLRKEVAELRNYRELSNNMVLRMERYEELLNLVGVTRAPEVTARVVAELRGPFTDSMIANAGHAEGVREGFSAINENGLVGRVVRVGEHTSRILVVTDFNSRIPVKGLTSGDRALLVGDSNSGARLIEPDTPELIVQGETWVTSGDDGQIPENVVVGRAMRDGDEWRVELSVGASSVDFVRLAPPPDFAKPEDAPVTDLRAISASPDNNLRSTTPAGGGEE